MREGFYLKRSYREKFQQYSIHDFQKDLLSGTIVGVVAIPLSMAFAIASGVKPEYGIYTTIIAGIIISLFGGSKFQIGGPTGAFIPILMGIVMTYGYENLLIAGFLSGIFLLFMGVLRFGSLIRFIPRPVTIGFTTGIAVIIFTGQIANFLGLTGIKKHESFLLNMKEIYLHFHTLNGYSFLTAMIGLSIILWVTKFLPKVPASLVGIVISSAIAFLVYPDKVATIGSTFGVIPSSLPEFTFPELSWDKMIQLIQPAFVIAILGSIESLLSAVVADGMTGTRHDSNKELIGQGIANMVAPLFGGIPATGAIARTATNIKSGATSRLSGVIHGLVVLLVLVLLAPFASSIPLASLAPILMIVAWNMSERKEFVHIIRTKTSDSMIVFITFLLTVFTNLTIAVEVGLILAVIMFVKRMSEIHMVTRVVPNPNNQRVDSFVVNEENGCPQVHILSIEGPLFFGASQSFEKLMLELEKQPKILILRMRKMSCIDTTGEAYLEKVVKHFQERGILILISGLQKQPKQFLKKTELYGKIGDEHIFDRLGEALSYALNHLDHNQCKGCKHYAFRECNPLANAIGKKDQDENREKHPMILVH